MSFLDRVRVSVRHIRGRMVESVLVILATAMGVALVAAMAAFIRSYNSQTDYLLSHPGYRELLVEVVGNETELTEPAVAFDPVTAREISLDLQDVRLALEGTPALDYGYLLEPETLSTRCGRGGVQGALQGVAEAFIGDPAAARGLAERAAELAPQLAEQFSGAARGGEPPPEGSGAVSDAQLLMPGSGAGRQGAASGEGGGFAGRQFDLEQFFQTDADVVTELPVENFPALRVTEQFFESYGLVAAQGSLFTEEDVEQGNQVIVLGPDLARSLFPEADAVGIRVRLNFQTYTVVGVLRSTDLTDLDSATPLNRVAFVPNAAARISFGGQTVRFQRPVRTLRFAVADSAKLEAASRQLQAHFDSLYGDGTIRVSAPLASLRTERTKLSRLLSVVMFLAAAGLFIASINLFNLMLMRVIKRTKGIGITRAVGASRRDVFRQFLNESALMSAVGATIGLLVSPVVYNLLRGSLVTDVPEITLVSWPYLILGAAGALAFSMLFGLYPARQAGRVDAALAIRTE